MKHIFTLLFLGQTICPGFSGWFTIDDMQDVERIQHTIRHFCLKNTPFMENKALILEDKQAFYAQPIVKDFIAQYRKHRQEFTTACRYIVDHKIKIKTHLSPEEYAQILQDLFKIRNFLKTVYINS